jgi:hypothetical protein
MVAQPLSALDELSPEIAEMRDGSTEAGHPKPQKNQQDFEYFGPLPKRGHWSQVLFLRVSGVIVLIARQKQV